jgi:hypothetical protein
MDWKIELGVLVCFPRNPIHVSGSTLVHKTSVKNNLVERKTSDYSRKVGTKAPLPQKLSNDQLMDLLSALAIRIEQEVSIWKESSRILLHHQLYVLRPDFSLLYTVNPMMRNFDVEEVQENTWDLGNLDQFIEEAIKLSPEYIEVLHKIEQTGLVEAFIRHSAYRLGTEQANFDLNASVQILVNELNGKPSAYYSKVYLTGLTLAEPSLSVSDSVLFRQPTREDVQEKIRAEAVHFAHFFHTSQVRFSCIAEVKTFGTQPLHLQQYLDRVIAALQLFNLGSVSSPQYDYRSDSFLAIGYGRMGMSPRTERTTYSLASKDVPRLDQFLTRLVPLLPSGYDVPEKDPDFFSTALQWYGECLLGAGPLQGAIASAVACLEALYLGDNPATEITFRLVNRVASLLGAFGWPALEVRQSLIAAYDVRSKYVHGASVSKKKLTHEALTRLFRETANYARVSCIIWLQLKQLHDRKEMLNLVERALIDESSRREMDRRSNRVYFARMPW